MFVADSSVWIDFFNGTRNEASDTLEGWLLQGDAEVLLPDLIKFEVLRGFRSEREVLDARRLLDALQVDVLGSEDHVLRAADRYRQLRRAGYTVRSTVDALLASWCIDHDHILLHRDRDFQPYALRFGLRVWPLNA